MVQQQSEIPAETGAHADAELLVIAIAQRTLRVIPDATHACGTSGIEILPDGVLQADFCGIVEAIVICISFKHLIRSEIELIFDFCASPAQI